MHKNRKLIVISAILYAQLFLFAGNTQAGTPTTLLEDTGAWFHAVGEGSLKGVSPSLDKVCVWVEGQSGFDQGIDHWYTGLVRVSAGYSITDRLTIWVGYTYTPTQNLDYNLELKGINVNGQLVGQQDFWPAFRYILPTGSGIFIFRTMWESNFGLGSKVRERPRQLIKFIHPLEFEPRLSLIAWNEVFYRINSTNWGGKSGFDQNRAFAGFGWTFNSNIRIELGYMNQNLSGSNHTNSTVHHLGMTSVFVDF
jgi:Protein of unknown function (DUF2490)